MDFGRCRLVKVQVAPPEFRKNLFVGRLVSGRGAGIYVRCTVFRMAGGGSARKRGAGLCVGKYESHRRGGRKSGERAGAELEKRG
jgi:hypothetical protein